jgi:hypothetical protein
MTKGVNSKGHSAPRKLRGNSKALSDRQRQGAEALGASGEDLACYHPEAKGVSRSCSAIEPAEAGYAYCFVSFALHSRICRQSPCSLCCFGKSTPSILATASTATTSTTRSATRRESALPPPAGLQRGVRSSHSQ